MTEELKPCPFCGWEKIKIINMGGTIYWYIVCEKCNGQTAHLKSKQDSIRFWNTRNLACENCEECADNAVNQYISESDGLQEFDSGLWMADRIKSGFSIRLEELIQEALENEEPRNGDLVVSVNFFKYAINLIDMIAKRESERERKE